MGCSGSLVHPAVIQSITKVDVATNTIDNDSSSNSTPTINPTKHSIEISTQTDDLQVYVKTNEENLADRDSNLKSNDLQSVLDNRNESNERTDDYINPRFNQELDGLEEPEWILNDLDANQFCISNQSLLMSANQVTPAMVVDAIEKTDDLKGVTKIVWDLLNKARKTGDATYLIRAYTAESNFYKILNRRLARQTLGNSTDMTPQEQIQTMMANVMTQFGQAISSLQAFQAGQQIQLANNTDTDWSKLYLKSVYRLIMTPNSALRYQGPTYRGMRLTQEEILRNYADKTHVCNKAITSTSKSRAVAQSFIDLGPRSENTLDVMFTYIIDSFSSLLAIDVHTLSLIPLEQEVLIMPGILFRIGGIKVSSSYSVDIEMHSVFQDFVNGGLANSLAELFTALQPDLD